LLPIAIIPTTVLIIDIEYRRATSDAHCSRVLVVGFVQALLLFASLLLLHLLDTPQLLFYRFPAERWRRRVLQTGRPWTMKMCG
jgi:hypothetical protein